MAQVFKPDFWADLYSGLLEPCQKGLASLVEVRHRWKGGERSAEVEVGNVMDR
jgi:hypothetical protein